LRLLFIFIAAIFSTRGGPKISLMWTCPPWFQSRLKCRYPSNEKS